MRQVGAKFLEFMVGHNRVVLFDKFIVDFYTPLTKRVLGNPGAVHGGLDDSDEGVARDVFIVTFRVLLDDQDKRLVMAEEQSGEECSDTVGPLVISISTE